MPPTGAASNPLPLMNIIFLLIGISLVVALLFLGGFFWAVRSGQYEDDYTPSVRMLFEDEDPE
ncbi:hypothetical protein GCM10027175_19890 [Hymenobacter latericoloratus]